MSKKSLLSLFLAIAIGVSLFACAPAVPDNPDSPAPAAGAVYDFGKGERTYTAKAPNTVVPDF